MNVYLVQHAEAKSKAVDPDRSLSETGRVHAEQVAAVAAGLGLRLEEIRHSGKTRAAETAAVLGEALKPAQGVSSVPGMGPMDNVEPVAEDLKTATQPIMLVGHLPFMERLAGYMLTGDPEKAIVSFRNAGIVCLREDGGKWQVQWILTPEIAAALG